jgi:hypothetical protein
VLPIPNSSWIHAPDDVLLFQTFDSRVQFHVGTKEIREAVATWHSSLFMGYQVTSCIACLCTKNLVRVRKCLLLMEM